MSRTERLLVCRTRFAPLEKLPMPEQDAARPDDATRFTDAPPANADATNFGPTPVADPDDTRFGPASPVATPTPTGSLPPTARDRRLPRRFAGYELLEEIARGGMGVVYKRTNSAPTADRCGRWPSKWCSAAPRRGPR